jgi:integrase
MNASGHVYIVKRKRGDQWYAKYRLPDGRQVQKLLGPSWADHGRIPEGYFTKKTAEAQLRALLTDADRGTLSGSVRTGVTFGDVGREWLEWVEFDRKRRLSTVKGYRSVFVKHLEPEFGALPLEKVTAERIDAYRRGLLTSAKLSDRSINKILTELHGIMGRAQRLYKLRSNPAAEVDRQPLRRSGDFNVLQPNEVSLLVNVAESKLDAVLFEVAAYSGLRLGELRALRWDDVDFSKALIHVRRSYTAGALGAPKSGRVRSVPLIDRAARALDALSRRDLFVSTDDLVFASHLGEYLDEDALRRRFYAALKRAGLPKLRFHDLRHTFGTLAVQAYPLSDVKAYMGHADISTTLVYVHHTPAHDAADKLEQILAAAESVSQTVSPTPAIQQNSENLGALEIAV